jgi:CheY-like chemotaxis protein
MSLSAHPDQRPIVIADDDREIRDVLSYRFSSAGWRVLTAVDGADMIALLETVDRAAAIFVDLLMPGVVGHSVIDYVQHTPRFRDVPLAVISASPELAPAGVQIFTKPARFAQLLDFVEGRGTPRLIRAARGTEKKFS